MTALATAVAGLALLVVALLVVPWRLEGRVRLSGVTGVRGTARLTWLSGLVRVPLAANGAKAPAAPPDAEQAKKEKTRTDRRRRSARRWLGTTRDILAVPGLGPRLARSAVRMIRCVRVNRLAGWLVLGLDDPADTGQLFGWLAPVLLVLPRGADRRLSVEPDFDGERLDGELDIAVRFIPAELVVVVIGAVLSRPLLELIWALTWKRWRRTRALAHS